VAEAEEFDGRKRGLLNQTLLEFALGVCDDVSI
jgi:hypothetical protein